MNEKNGKIIDEYNQKDDHNGMIRCKKCQRWYPQNDPEITDGEILEYLLRVYHLDKKRLIDYLKYEKSREKIKMLIRNFYHEYPMIKYKSLNEQYHAFQTWNDTDIEVSREDFLRILQS
jgi:hypothetical protein